MRAVAAYQRSVSTSFPGISRKSAFMPGDLALVGLWTMLGLSLTGLIISLGFAADLAELLAVVE